MKTEKKLKEETIKPEIIYPQDETIPSKATLFTLILLSSGLDFVLTTASFASTITTLGGSIVIEEIVEYFISKLLAKSGMKIELSKTDKLIGFIPIPGFTGISVRCLKLLLKYHY